MPTLRLHKANRLFIYGSTLWGSTLWRPKMWLASVAVLAGIAAASPASASSSGEYPMIATIKGSGDASVLQALRLAPEAKSLTPMFSPSEREWLRRQGRRALAEAVSFRVDSAKTAAQLRARLQRVAPDLEIEAAEIPFRSLEGQAATRPSGQGVFERMQWALDNPGVTENLALDDLTSLTIQGRAGEDLGIKSLPPENPSNLIRIAVLDTGIDYAHPEMADRLVESPSECRALVEYTQCLRQAGQNTGARQSCDTQHAQRDTDGNGYPLDCSGWNLTAKSLPTAKVWGDSDPKDINGHGTHVSGAIAARIDDGDGIRGVMKQVRILPVKVIAAGPAGPVRPMSVNSASQPSLTATGLPSPEESAIQAPKGLGDLIARGLLYALRSNAQIVNMSLGWPADVESPLMQQMLDLAKARGVLVVAAAGNDGTDALIRPCVYEGVICVASHDPDGAISHFSNHGPGVDVAAPGLNILSLYPSTVLSRVFTERVGYEIKSGTSMAAPYVAAALARLMNLGVSPTEAYARIIAGARASYDNPRVRRTEALRVQAGNVDVVKAWQATPRPLVLPASKRAIELRWDRVSREIRFRVPLTNLWADAAVVNLDAELYARGRPTSDARLVTTNSAQANWRNGERRELEFALRDPKAELESELRLRMQIVARDSQGQVFTDIRWVGLDVVSAPDAQRDAEISRLPIAGPANEITRLRSMTLRSVESVDGVDRQDYIGVQAQAQEIHLSLLAERQGQYQFVARTSVPATRGELLSLQRVDLDQDQHSDYVLVWRVTPTPPRKQPSFMFRFFNSKFEPLRMRLEGQHAAEIEFTNTVTVINERFQWLRLKGQLVPVWISRGTTPELEKPAFDPWDPNPIDMPQFRFYYWAEDGLRSLGIKDKTPVAMLPGPTQTSQRVVWLSGTGTDSIYEVSDVADQSGKLASTALQQINLGGFRQLRPTAVAPVLSTSGGVVGTLFHTDSFRSALRVSTLHGVRGQGIPHFDQVLTPMSQMDSLTSIVAGFTTPSGQASVAAQSIYELQYHDIARGEVVSTSLRRFSFLPGFFFLRLFFPAIGELSATGERTPMVFLPAGLGTGASVEVLVPRRSATGSLEALVRPARLRLSAPTGCEAMGNVIPAQANTPASLVFFCGDSFWRVPMTY